MNVFQNLFIALNKPFPEDESRFGSLKTIALISLFIVFFLYIFQPFGISSLESNVFWICLGFGSMTFIGAFVYQMLIDLIFGRYAQPGQWKFWKWILNNLGLMLAISIANFLFARWVLFGYIDWSLFPSMVYGTFMVGLIPTLILGAWSLIRQERKYQGIAKEISAGYTSMPSHKPSSHMVFDITLDQYRYIEALQNYVKIGYVDEQKLFQTKVIRATMKQASEEMVGSPIVRCHRSFFINKDFILSAEGNAQGLILSLSDCEDKIPVSRSYVPQFRSR